MGGLSVTLLLAGLSALYFKRAASEYGAFNKAVGFTWAILLLAGAICNFAVALQEG